jgi:putative peptidoglycan lipid II flippase
MIAGKMVRANLIQAINLVAHLAFGLLLAFYFGASKEMDAFVAAQNFIIFFSALFITGQSSAFIPFLSDHSRREGQASIFTGILTLNLILFTFLAVIFMAAAYPIANVVVPGMDEAGKRYVAGLLRILAGNLLFSNISGIAFALLDYKLKFELRYTLQTLQSILIIVILVLLAPHIGVYGAGTAVLVANALIAALAILLLQRQNVSIRLGVFQAHIAREYISLMAPTMVTSFSVLAIRYLETYMSSFLESGSLSYIGYCMRIESNISVVAIVIASIYYPLLSKLAQEGNKNEFLTMFFQGFQIILCIALGLTSFLLIFANDIIQLLFERGSFVRTNTLVLSKVILLYGFVFIGSPLGAFFANAYFSYKRTRTAMFCGLGSMLAQAICIIVLGRQFGLSGIVAAASLGIFIGNTLQAVFIRKINDNYSLLKLVRAAWRPLTAIFITDIVFFAIKKYFGLWFGWAAFKAFQGLIVYLGAMFFGYILFSVMLHYVFRTAVVVEGIAKMRNKVLSWRER